MILGNNYRMKIKIPIGNMSRKDAEKTLAELIADYKKEVEVNYLPDRKSKIDKILSKINPLK